jgi:hypothetical protein
MGRAYRPDALDATLVAVIVRLRPGFFAKISILASLVSKA